MTVPHDDVARHQNRLVKAVEEALSVAKGEKPSASIYVNGHKYVPATAIDALRARVKELERERDLYAECSMKEEDCRKIWQSRARRLQRERDEQGNEND